jgi:hypothetical protein
VGSTSHFVVRLLVFILILTQGLYVFQSKYRATQTMPSAKYFKLAQRDSAFAESEVKETVPSLRYKAYNVALSLLLLLNIILSVLWYRESACFGCRGRLVYCMCTAFLRNVWTCSQHTTAPYAKDAQYERRRLFRDMQENVFAGPPRPAHDAAWRTIVERTSLHTFCNVLN